MCILLYVKLIWCSGITQMYGQLEEVYIYPWQMFILLYVKTDWVKWCCIDLWSIRGRGPWYMYILLYMKLIWCCGITQICGQLEEGALVYVHSSICKTYMGVVVLHRSMLNWKEGPSAMGRCAFSYI